MIPWNDRGAILRGMSDSSLPMSDGSSLPRERSGSGKGAPTKGGTTRGPTRGTVQQASRPRTQASASPRSLSLEAVEEVGTPPLGGRTMIVQGTMVELARPSSPTTWEDRPSSDDEGRLVRQHVPF